MSKFFHRKTVRAFLRYQCCCEFDEIDYYHSVGSTPSHLTFTIITNMIFNPKKKKNNTKNQSKFQTISFIYQTKKKEPLRQK